MTDSPSAPHSRAAVIDLGSNSLKLVNYNVSSDNNYKPYHHESVRVRLGEGLEDGVLRPKYVDRTVDALKLFRNIVDFEQIDYVVCIATSAARDAKNRDELLEQIHKHTGFSFTILSEWEEAAYSYAGASRALRIPTAVFFDIGGGSLEIVYAEQYEIKKMASLPLGTLRLRQAFCGKRGSFTSEEYRDMKRHAASLLPSREALGVTGDVPIVGVGGVLRAIAKHDQAVSQYPLSKVHNYRLSADSIKKTAGQLSGLSVEKIARIESIGAGRADTVQPGACAISELVKKMGGREVIVSAQGLREGALAVSLQGPRRFRGGHTACTHLARDVICLASHPDTLSEYVEDLVRLLFSMDLVSEHERLLLAQSILQMGRLSLFREADNVLHSILDDDSPLSHRDQLVIALSLIYSKKRKKAESLMAKYARLVDSADRKAIKKISSIVSVCDIFHKTGTRVLPSAGGSVLSLAVHPSGNAFPEALFGRACERMEGALNISVRPSVLYADRTGSRTRPLGIV